jgi:PAS domain S-box-containing protein
MNRLDSRFLPEDSANPTVAAEGSEAKKPRIMIVEDEGITAMQLKSCLTDLNYEVVSIAAKGEDAVNIALSSVSPDLILMDIRLAGEMTGIKAAESIREVLDIPVIYLTANADEKTIAQAKLTQPYGYIIKPLNPLAVNSAIEMALYRYEADVKRRQVEDQIRKAKDEWEQTFDAMSDLLMIVDSEYGITKANKAFIERLNLPFSKVLGQKCFKIFHDSDAPPAGCLYKKMQSSRHDVSGELQVGSRTYMVSVSPLFGPTGDLTGAIHAARDITDSKELERQIRNKSLLLEDLNRDLQNAALKEYRHWLEKEEMLVQQSKMASMGEMIGAIAHQWKQPLNALGLIVQSLQDAYENGEVDKTMIDRVVDETMEQIRFMSKTIDDFRNFMSPSKEKQVFDVKIAAGEVFSLLSAQLKINSILYSLTCHVHDKTFHNFSEIQTCGEFETNSYKNEFKQIILNLITNAKDAILERRKKGLMKGDGKGKISIDFYKKDNKIIIELSDNGGGIPEEHISKVFDAHFTTKEKDTGTGIGLYIARTIIEKNMGGKLSVANIEGGARFTIELSR